MRPVWFQSPWIRFARDFLKEVADALEVSIPVDKVRAHERKSAQDLALPFQSPWIRFAQRKHSAPNTSAEWSVSIPVDKVRASDTRVQARSVCEVSIPVDKVRAGCYRL